MSRLRPISVKGPFTTGRRLPLASIEKVYIKNNIEWSNPAAYWSPPGTGEGLSVTVNVNLQSINVQKPESFLQESGDEIYIYVVLVIGSVEIESIKRHTSKIMSYMRNANIYEETGTSYTIPGSGEEGNILIYKNFAKATLNDFTYIQESFEDFETQEIPIYKYSAELEIPMYGTYDNFSDLFDNAYVSEAGQVDYTDATVFCFSSYYDFDVTTATDAPWEVSSVLLGTAEDNTDQYHFPAIFNLKISDITYEEAFISAEVADGPRVRYTYDDGTPYDHIPIRSISGKYHAPPPQEHDVVNSTFTTFTGLALGQALATEPVQAARTKDLLDNVLAIVSEKRNDPDILIELNKLKQAWPNKSTATETGRLFEAFRDMVQKSNEIVSSYPTLRRRVVQNYKIIDYRQEVTTGDYSPPDTTVDISSWFSATRDRIYDDIAFTRLGFDDDADLEFNFADVQYVQNKGFVFFDYEKAIYNDSNIARVFDTTKIDDLFGKSFLNATFTIEKLYYLDAEYQNPASDSVKSRMIAYYEDALDENGAFLVDRPTIEYVYHKTMEDQEYGYASINLSASPLTPATTLYSYLAHRNVVPALDEDYEDYRLLAIEVSDLQSAARSHRAEKMEVFLTVADNTLHALTALTSSYYNTYLTLQEYYNAAADHCSYNNIDFYFNTFFADHIKSQYAGDDLNSPWNRAPIIYNIHLDLLYGTFAGNKTEIVDNAKKIIERINPDTGTLPDLEKFFEDYQQLWTTFYESGTDFNSTVEGISQTSVGYLNRWLHAKEYVQSQISSNPWFMETTDPDYYRSGVPEIYYTGEYSDETELTEEAMSAYRTGLRASMVTFFNAAWESMYLVDWLNYPGDPAYGAVATEVGSVETLEAWSKFTDVAESVVSNMVDYSESLMEEYDVYINTSPAYLAGQILQIYDLDTEEYGTNVPTGYGIGDTMGNKLAVAINTVFKSSFDQSIYDGGKCYTNEDCWKILLTEGASGWFE